MDIGIARENRPNEKRVILWPDELKKIALKHSVFVEKGAGENVGIKDNDYEKIRARIVDTKQVYGCPLVVRLKEPKEDELSMMKPGSVIMSMMHLKGNPQLRALLKKYKTPGVSITILDNSEIVYTKGFGSRNFRIKEEDHVP